MTNKAKNDKNSSQKFVVTIRQAMDKKKMSLREVAKKAGISPTGLLRILRGEYLPSNDAILRLAKALNIVPPELLLYFAGKIPQQDLTKLPQQVSPEELAETIDQLKYFFTKSKNKSKQLKKGDPQVAYFYQQILFMIVTLTLINRLKKAGEKIEPLTDALLRTKKNG